MSKTSAKEKMNNRGITLLEIVVCIAIIGVVAVPLFNFFIIGLRTNNRARETEDAQQVAQNVAEAFEATDLELLLEKMQTNGQLVTIGQYTNVKSNTLGSTIDYCGNTEKYLLDFQDAITGDGEETYYVEAVLESTSEMNSLLPKTVDIGSKSDNVLQICEDYYEDDGAHTSVTEPKVSTYNIDVKYVGADTYECKVTLTVAYNNVAEDPHVYSKKITYDGTNPMEIFLICNFFDTTNNPSTDKVVINYTYDADGSVAGELPCNVYLVQQAVGSTKFNIAPGFVKVSKQTGTTGMKVYSNIEWGDYDEYRRSAGIEDSSVAYKQEYTMYNLTINVREDSATGEVVAGVTTAITK